MSWAKSRPRTLDERIRISRGVRRYYGKHTDFIRTKNKVEYKDPYNYERKMSLLVQAIQGSDMLQYNKAKLLAYRDHLLLTTGQGYAYKTLCVLRLTLEKTDKNLYNIGKKDFSRIYIEIQQSGLSSFTKADRVNTLKGFLKWVQNGKGVEYLKEFKTRKKIPVERDFTLDDVKMFIRACESDEERAFFSLLWEGGFSVGELLKVKLKDLTVKEDMVIMHVRSKDRDRNIPILRKKGRVFPLESYKHLMNHLEKMRNMELDDCIWTIEAYGQIQYRMSKIKRKVGLNHIRLHTFRKSRATYNDNIGLSFIKNCIFGGWSIGSRTLQHYILRSSLSLTTALEDLN